MSTEVISDADSAEPLLRRKTLTAFNPATMYTEIDCGEYGYLVTDEPIAHGGTGEGPSPLQTVLGALAGCESVTFNRTAADLDFDYESITYEAEFTIDIRGRLGNRAVRQHFQTVRLEATVVTSESEDRLREIVEETEARCPVYNLINDAGVNLEVRWIRKLPN
jgi:putative redox protein